MMDSRVRRRFRRGLKRKHMALLKKLRAAKKEATELEKPAVVKTHLRNMVIVPEMVGSIVGVYNGKVFNSVEVKVSSINEVKFFLTSFDSNVILLQPEMIGHHLGEFSICYKPVKHGRPGIGATHSSRFIPLK